MIFGVEKRRQQVIWQQIRTARRELDVQDFPSMVRYLRGRGEELTVPELMYIQERWHVRDRSPGLPMPVPLSAAQFFLNLLKERQGSRILDPYGGYGLLGAGIAVSLSNRQVDVNTPISNVQELIEPFQFANLSVNTGTTGGAAEVVADQYDAIVSVLPFREQERMRERRSYLLGDDDIELNDYPSLLSIVDLAPRLSDKGFFALVVQPRFAWEERPDSVRQNLGRFGLHISALLRFRPGTFTGTGIAFELVIIDRQPRNNMFVAEIPDDLNSQTELITRLHRRKQGRIPGHGRLVSPDNFHGLAALEARERYDKIVKGKGLNPVPFTSVVPHVLNIRPGRRDAEFGSYEEHPCAVYLPEIGKKNATTRQDDILENIRLYLQLFVDPSVVLPEYLAGWFNTPVGQSLRQTCMKGNMISRINIPLLKESRLFLPPIEEQRLVLQADGDIRRLRSQLSEIESKLWDQPKEASKLIDDLENLNNEERFLDWVETLPFPLASILRLYQTSDRTDKEKYERLLHFFEAFSQFNATVHISAFKSNEMLWEQKRERIIQNIRKQRLFVERASFGLWRVIGEQLSASLREMLADDDQKSEACELYATSDIFPLEMLSSSEIVGLLQRVNSFRNRWTGHGGAVTDDEAADRLRLLEGELAKFREIFGTGFLQYQLIEPHEGRTLEGPTFLYRIRRVMGSNPQLEQDEIELISPAISNNLYLYNTGHNKALKLVPLIQVHDSLQPTSYFYNRLERSGPHLISYHLASESEITDSNTALLSIIDDLTVKPEDIQEADL